MSKSLGNVVDPLKIMEQSGADILRLWTMTSDYAEDIRIGKDTIKNTSDLYRRIRNTLRFLLGALDGFTKSEMVEFFEDPSALPELEQLVLHQLYEMDQKVRGYIQNHEYGKLAKELHEFCNNNLSAFYFDIRKDRLYCDDPNSFERKACRSVMAVIFNGLSAWLAPILSFTAEEAWSHRPAGVFEDTESVHLREFPQVPERWKNDALSAKWHDVKKLKDQANLSLENIRTKGVIKSSLEAQINMHITESSVELFEQIDIDEILIVSEVTVDKYEGGTFLPDEVPNGHEKWQIGQAADNSFLQVHVQKAEGEKCVRCWKVLPEVSDHADCLCNRCDNVVNKKQAA